MKHSNYNQFKKLILMITKGLLISFITFSIYLFISYKKNPTRIQGNYYSKIMTRFIDQFNDNNHITFVKNWFHVNPSHIKVNQEEKIIQYKLRILCKGLNNYFANFTKNTENILNNSEITDFLIQNSYSKKKDKINSLLKTYLINNKDLLEISLFKTDGKKLSTVKYHNIQEYILHPNILKTLENKDNLLIKSKSKKHLIVISKVKKNNQTTILISQTLDNSFFTKILDYLEINQDLFYLKNTNNEMIIDNYEAYEFIRNKQYSIPFLLYQKLTSVSNQSIKLKIKNTEYTLGAIIEKNNSLGNLLAILSLFFFFYLAMLLFNFTSYQISTMINESKKQKFYQKKKEKREDIEFDFSKSL